MIITNDEAKEYWCPVSFGSSDGPSFCCGTDCMAFTPVAFTVEKGKDVTVYRCGMSNPGREE